MWLLDQGLKLMHYIKPVYQKIVQISPYSSFPSID